MSGGTIFRNISPDSEEARQAALEGEVPELGPDFFKRAQIRYKGHILREADGTFTKRGRPPLGDAAKSSSRSGCRPRCWTISVRPGRAGRRGSKRCFGSM